MQTILNFLKAYWRSVLLALIIMVLTTLRLGEMKIIPELPVIGKDKLAHFFVFFILATFMITDLQKNTNFSLSKIIWMVIMICLTYGSMIELIQLWFMEYRTASIYDVLANMTGCLSACYLQSKYNWLKY